MIFEAFKILFPNHLNYLARKLPVTTKKFNIKSAEYYFNVYHNV